MYARSLLAFLKRNDPGKNLKVAAVSAGGVCLCAAFLWSCAMSMPSGDLGLTMGGQQDIAAARQVIEDGRVPDPDWITVEGFMSEHSIPVEEPENAGLLYTTAKAAWNQDFEAFTPLATVQIGFGTTLDRESFERDDLNLCLVIDQSGSMGDSVDRESFATKLDAVRIAVDRLLPHLTADDRVSLVTFNNRSWVRLEDAAGNDIAAIKTALHEFQAEKGTDLASGLRTGYRTVKKHSSNSRSDRVLVFTDALLTWVDEIRVENFINVMKEYAEDNIGASVFGIGVDFGHEVAYEISQVRGGNYFFLGDYDRIVSVFDEEFDYLVTPVAYDIELQVTVPFEFDVAEVYGIPAPETLPHALNLTIPTLFLSSREGGGAIMVRTRAGAMVDFESESTLAEISLSYTTPDGETETAPVVHATLPAGLDSTAAETYFENDSTRRGVLLLNTALTLSRVCESAYSGSWYYYDSYYRAEAAERLADFLPYFASLADGLEDSTSATSRTLSQERALLEKLLDNIAPYTPDRP